MSAAASSSSSSRVSIPNSLRKTIQNLQEIAKNHSEEEIYAMLRECSMDPNETAQRLLFQDPFHEVKRKRDKKKVNNMEPAYMWWKSASHGRGGGGGGRGNFPARFESHGTGGERIIGKENGVGGDKVNKSSSLAPSQDTKIKTTSPASSSLAVLPNGPAKTENPVKENPSIAMNKTVTPPAGDSKGSGVYASASDPILVPSLDGRTTGSVSTIKRQVGAQRTGGKRTVNTVISRDVCGPDISSVGKASSSTNNSHIHGKVQASLDVKQLMDASQATSSLSRPSSASSRPSSNYSNHSQQPNGFQKVVAPTKEWKPKSTNVKTASVSSKLETSDVELSTQDADISGSLPASASLSEDCTISQQKRLRELQFSETKHVIIPNHLQVSESERTGLSFGSFDANFEVTTSSVNGTGSDKGLAELSGSSQEREENGEIFISSNQNASPTAQETEYVDHPTPSANCPGNNTHSGDQSHSPVEMPENLTSREHEEKVSSSIPTAREYEKLDAASPPDSSQYSVIHTAPTFPNFGLVPQVLGSQFATFSGVEAPARDATRMPNFLVQQPFDPTTNCYTSVYRPTADGDGRFSPYVTPAGSNKYTGNVAILPTQNGHTPQESGNSVVLPSTDQAPLVSQASGVMQSSLTPGQQVPVFRQTPGVHFSHFPHSFHPYSQYISPIYLPSPSMHPFLSNTAFHQQSPTGNMYPTQGAVGTATMKYPISQFKPTTNNPSHIGMPTTYGNYNPGTGTTGSSTGTDDLTSSQYKENNVYIAGQQAESSLWIPAPGRDISSIQATSFYNLPTQGQHMAFSGIYHHPGQTVPAATIHPMLQQSQAMAGPVEMVVPPSGAVYQQPQRTQFSWIHNH